MAKEVSSSLGESDLLLILEMCNERIEKCDLRERQNVHERPGRRKHRQTIRPALRIDELGETVERIDAVGFGWDTHSVRAFRS